MQLCSGQYKRLGDLPPSTVRGRDGLADKEQLPAGGDAVVFRLLDTSVLSRIDHLSQTEYRTVQHFLERRNELPPSLRAELARRLALQLIAKFGYQSPVHGMDYVRWLEELDLAYRRACRSHGAREIGPRPPASSIPHHRWMHPRTRLTGVNGRSRNG